MKTNRITELINKYQNLLIKSIDELEQIIHEIQELRIYYDVMENYRGHSLDEYKLNSGLARYDYPSDKLNEIEKNIYIDFFELVKSKEDYIRLPFKDDTENYVLRNKWYSLFQAQHIGLKTRFMDWSINWRVALMFAVENEDYFEKNGSLTIFIVPNDLLYHDKKLTQTTATTDPFDVKIDMMINTPTYMFDDKFDFVGERRMGRQNGRFWMQSIENCNIPLEEQEIYKPLLLNLIIDGDSKQSIKTELERMGYTIDWHYFRKDEDVDKEIVMINEINLGKN
jgi:hypothetical protein